MPIINDDEFGDMTVRKVANARSMKVTVAPNGTLRISVPSMTPQFVIKRMIASSRSSIRKLLEARPQFSLHDGMQIGKSHTLIVVSGTKLSIKKSGLRLILTLAAKDRLADPRVSEMVREQVTKILRIEAKAHLPNRLGYIAEQYGFHFTKLRFSHASTRWGSCSSAKVISLNIALMNLPFELIDYVLIHELAHTVELNHSAEFWSIVENADPNYKQHRKLLKTFSPGV